MSLFELSTSCETADGSAIKLVDIEDTLTDAKELLETAGITF